MILSNPPLFPPPPSKPVATIFCADDTLLNVIFLVVGMWHHSIDCRLDFGKNDGPTFHPSWQFVTGIPYILYVSMPDAYLACSFHLSILGTQRSQALNKAKFLVIIFTQFVRMDSVERMTVS